MWRIKFYTPKGVKWLTVHSTSRERAKIQGIGLAAKSWRFGWVCDENSIEEVQRDAV